MSYTSPHHPPPPPCYCGQHEQVRGTNVLAILSLIFTFVCTPLGYVFGVAARRQIRRTGEEGWGMATFGMVASWLIIVGAVLAIVLVGFVVGTSPSSQ